MDSSEYWRCCRDEVALSVLCPWDGGVFDLPDAGIAAGAVARYSAGCRLCRRGDCCSLGISRSCDEEFYFAGCRVLEDSSSRVERLRIPSG
ncbi:hypothetical protein CRG98_017683 [Punica granatum]|uniref:Uncharacterized protein n=1 Tax=Punica granatum TaxID=22663 RepID=A0A2I0K060_PUNGR|nr:hypothetical protein CRG98_017683 [Punica granatum]